MFTTFTYKRGRIVSSQGFSVYPGKDGLKYEEAGRTMFITSDYGAGGINIFKDTVGRWDDEPSIRISEYEISRILANIASALDWKTIPCAILD